jgi:phenylacetate-CoA ligase
MRGFLKTWLKQAPLPFSGWAETAFHILPRSVRYGKPFVDADELLHRSERWDLDRLQAYQEDLLRELTQHCAKHVPYYRDIFRERGLTPNDIRTLSDLEKLPLLTKATVRNRKRDLLAENFSSLDVEPVATSGSTGSPLEFYYDADTKGFDRALALRHLKWMGYVEGDSLAHFKALPLLDPRKTLKWLPGARELKVSFHYADEARLEEIASALDSVKPSFIDAWPSCLYVLCRWLLRKGRKPPIPKGIRTASENLRPLLRDMIQEVFRAPVVDWYGQEESVAVAMQCLETKGYHIQSEMAVLELIPTDTPGVCEIVGTGLHNRAMPFIRYRTGDLAVKGEGPCPCGRSHPTLSKIIGRSADFVLTPEGSVISSLILQYAFDELGEVREAQLVQETMDTLIARVVPWDRLSDHTRDMLLRGLQDRLLSQRMKIVIEVTDDIPASPGGKRPFVLSRIQPEKGL